MNRKYFFTDKILFYIFSIDQLNQKFIEQMIYSIDFGGKNIIISKENNGSINILNDDVKNNKNLYYFHIIYQLFYSF